MGGFNFESYQNTLMIGTTRSGKTTAMLHIIERRMKEGIPIFIISGKNGANDRYSMYRQVKALCKKHKRKLYAWSTHHNVKNEYVYNPFKYAEPNGISNTMTVMAQYSDTHYESNFEYWVLCICEVLQKAGKELSLSNIMKIFKWKKFLKVVEELDKNGKLSEEDADEYHDNDDIAKIAAPSRARFMKYLKGSGKRILKGINTISVEDVKNEGAVFLMDLDGLMYKDFSFSLGTMVVSDLRTMISRETDFNTKKLIVFDELSVFFSPLLPDIYSQAVGFGYQSIAGSQSFSDMDKISPDLAERMIENSHMFGFLLQNSASDAERAAAIMGTRKSTETTVRKEGGLYGNMGSEKVIEKYKVHPNVIKELNPLEMVFYDKTQKSKVPYKIIWPYLNL